jgi:hypothetical protein
VSDDQRSPPSISVVPDGHEFANSGDRGIDNRGLERLISLLAEDIRTRFDMLNEKLDRVINQNIDAEDRLSELERRPVPRSMKRK